MKKTDGRYGGYWGDLRPAGGIIFGDYGLEWTEKLVREMRRCGVTEVFFPVEDEGDGNLYSDTMFFGTDEGTDFKGLLKLLVPRRPHEFDETSPGYFRMWYD